MLKEPLVVTRTKLARDYMLPRPISEQQLSLFEDLFTLITETKTLLWYSPRKLFLLAIVAEQTDMDYGENCDIIWSLWEVTKFSMSTSTKEETSEVLFSDRGLKILFQGTSRKKKSKWIPISTLEAQISHGTKELVSNRRVKGIISRYYSVVWNTKSSALQSTIIEQADILVRIIKVAIKEVNYLTLINKLCNKFIKYSDSHSWM